MFIKRPHSGDRLSAPYLGKIVDKLNFETYSNFSHIVSNNIIVAEIWEMTATDGVYKWWEVRYDLVTDDWVRTGRKGDNEVDTYAYEVDFKTDVPDGSYVYLVSSGNDSPRWTFAWPGGTYGTPATVGTTAETEAAQTDTFDRDSQGANDGVNVVMMTRIAYSDTGDEKLYAYYRTFKFDNRGLLVTVSAETIVTVDEPEAC